MQKFNFRLIDWSAVTTESFSIAPVNFFFSFQGAIVNGNVFSSSTAPVSYSLVPNLYHVQLNSEATNDWYIQTTGSTVTASAAIVSGSYSSGSICSVHFSNRTSTQDFGAFTDVEFEPITKKNVGFNDSFVLADSVTYTTDATGSLTVSLVPQAYCVTWKDGYRNKSYQILVPNSSSVDASLCIVTSTNVAKIITLKNSALYSYTADVIDQKFASITSSVALSSSYAQTASFALNAGGGGTTITTGSVLPVTSSWSSNSNTASALVPANSYKINNLTASSVSCSNGYFNGVIINSINANLELHDRTNNSMFWTPYAIGGHFAIWNSLQSADSLLLKTEASQSKLEVIGNISCSVITASLLGNASTATSASYVTNLRDIHDDTVSHFIGINIPQPKTTLDLNGNIGNSTGLISAQIDCGNAILLDENFNPSLNWNALTLSGSWSGSISNALTASQSISASYSVKTATATSSSFATTSSFSFTAITADFATNATSAAFATNASTAAFANGLTFTPTNATSASFAQTASFITASKIVGTVTSASWSATASIAQTISPVTWSAISAASAVTWSASPNVYEDRHTLTVTGPTTMSIQGLYNGWSGVLKVKNGNTGSLLYVTPTPKVINGFTGSVLLTNISASIDVIAFDYDGTDLMAAAGNNFN